MLREMEEKDIATVVDMHCNLIKEADFPMFGRAFMIELYEGILHSSSSVPIVAEEEGEIRGFIVGATSSGRLFRDILKQRGINLAAKILFPLLVRPRLWKKVWDILTYTSKTHLPDIEAEMPYIALYPGTRGKGLGRALVREVLKSFSALKIKKVKVTTHVDNEGPNKLLIAMGFHLETTLDFLGKSQNLYWGEIDEVFAREEQWGKGKSEFPPQSLQEKASE